VNNNSARSGSDWTSGADCLTELTLVKYGKLLFLDLGCYVTVPNPNVPNAKVPT
jgi:hypothetical protein